MSNVIKNMYINMEETSFIETEKLSSFLETFSKETVDDINNKDNKEREVVNKSISLKERELAVAKKENEILQKEEEIIREAGETAENIIKAANKQAGVIEEKAKAEGYENGYREGVEKAKNDIDEEKLKLENEYLEKEHALKKKNETFERDFVECVTTILEKITGVMVEDKKDVILHMINREFADIEKSKNYTIRVSKEDYDWVYSKKQSLQSYMGAETTLEIMATDNFETNMCVIETDNSVIDCSLDTQLDNLITDLRLLSTEVGENGKI